MTTEERLDRLTTAQEHTEARFDQIGNKFDQIGNKFDQIAHNFEALHDSIKRLENVVAPLAASVVAHDNQIEQLIAAAEENKRQWQDLHRQWQAYLNTLPKQ